MNKLELLVRGTHGGVLITLPAVPWYQQRDLLVGRIQTQERFFKGGRIALDVGSTDWSEEQLLRLMKDLADEGVCLWTILSSSEKTRQAAAYHGFPTTLPDPNRKPEESHQAPADTIHDLESIVCLPRSLAPGENFQNTGDLLVIGDVPLDAKLEVTGSLVLWGTLFGSVSVKTDSDPTKNVRLLRIENGHLFFDAEEVEIPAKLRKQNGILVSRGENGIDIQSLIPRRLF
jgi:septum formation inhibitor MinC